MKGISIEMIDSSYYEIVLSYKNNQKSSKELPFKALEIIDHLINTV